MRLRWGLYPGYTFYAANIFHTNLRKWNLIVIWQMILSKGIYKWRRHTPKHMLDINFESMKTKQLYYTVTWYKLGRQSEKLYSKVQDCLLKVP